MFDDFVLAAAFTTTTILIPMGIVLVVAAAVTGGVIVRGLRREQAAGIEIDRAFHDAPEQLRKQTDWRSILRRDPELGLGKERPEQHQTAA